jgi:hypothetical protein
MSSRTGYSRQQRSRGLGFEQLEDRWLLSGASLLASVSLPLPISLAASLSVDLAPLGVSVSASVQTGGKAPALTVAAAVATDPATPSPPASAPSLAIQTPLTSVSVAVGLGDGTGGNGGVSLSGTPAGGGTLTVGTARLGSASATLSPNSNTGGQGLTLPNLEGNPSGGQTAGVTLPATPSATQPTAGSTAAQPSVVPAAPAATGSDPAPFLVPALVSGASNATPANQAAQAIVLSREAALAVLSLPATAPGMSAALTAPSLPDPVPADNLAAASDNGQARAALRAASYNLDEEEATVSAEEYLPDEATEAGPIGLVPADGSGIDQSLRQLLDQLSNLGQGLNQTLPSGLAFWVLAGAVGVMACVTVRRRQAAQAALSGDGLRWIPSLIGFLPPPGG